MASNLKRFLASKFNIFGGFLLQPMPAICEYLSQTLLSWCLNFSFKMEAHRMAIGGNLLFANLGVL